MPPRISAPPSRLARVVRPLACVAKAARRAVGLAALATVLAATRGAAQLPLNADPAQAWRTMRTEHFRIHYRAEAVAWARHVAERIEGIRAAVGREVGYLPPRITDIVIDDPVNQPNGMALPFMDGPVMFFWPTPPDPASGLAQQSTWGELLSIHEFAHVAHLSRPSREPLEKLEQLIPIVPHLGPIPRRVPAWVTEGYATLVEGKLTGSGRPNSAWRAAVLRSWALEGMLPAYDDIDDGGAFLGGSMRYLVGSAYLEWLARARGDSALPQLWRRLTARVPREFDEAFRGTFGESPRALYGQFLVELTARAFAVREQRTTAGLVEGTRVARFEHGAGAPALSPDGSRVALSLAASGGRPSRIEVWTTASTPPDSIAIRAQQRLLEDDPEDVADTSIYPRRPRAVSVLWPVRGRGHAEPRFLPDGRRLLVTRSEPLAGGAFRPDLFIWDPRLNTVDRVTHGAGIRSPDPTPDGAAAVAIRCGNGTCDLVEVTLATGALRVIAAGSSTRTFAGARIAPDGERIATAVHEGGRWRVAIVARQGGEVRFLDAPDRANRFMPSWAPDGRSLVVVSEALGVADVERVALDGTVQPLTRALTATQYPTLAPNGRDLWFLTLHARGWDVRTLAVGDAGLAPVGGILAPPAVVGARAEPASVRPPAPPASGPTWPLNAVTDGEYGLGPRGWRLLPVGAWATVGNSVGLALVLQDPVGRLSGLVQGAWGDRSAWRGLAAGLAWRGDRPGFTLDAWWARQEPGRGPLPIANGTRLDEEQLGAAAAVTLDRTTSLGTHAYAAGLLGGSVAPVVGGEVGLRDTRLLAYAEFAHHYGWVRAGNLVLVLGGAANLSRGTTQGTDWTRAIASALVRTGTRSTQLEVSGTYGRVSSAAPVSEQLQVGGMLSPLLPAAAQVQRLEDPALAPGALIGNQAARVRTAITSGSLSLFWEAVAAGRRVDHAGWWWRVAGAELRLPLPASGTVRLPTLDVRLGGAYAFDDVREPGWRGWVMLSARP